MYRYRLTGVLIVCAFSLIAHAETLRDPTQPPGMSENKIAGNNLHVDAIFFNKKNAKLSTLLIGGKYLAIGDKIMGATIIDIKPHEITLKDDNGEFIVTNDSSSIKTPTIKINKKKRQ